MKKLRKPYIPYPIFNCSQKQLRTLKKSWQHKEVSQLAKSICQNHANSLYTRKKTHFIGLFFFAPLAPPSQPDCPYAQLTSHPPLDWPCQWFGICERFKIWYRSDLAVKRGKGLTCRFGWSPGTLPDVPLTTGLTLHCASYCQRWTFWWYTMWAKFC